MGLNFHFDFYISSISAATTETQIGDELMFKIQRESLSNISS